MNCLIAGSSGLIGSYALKFLLDSPKVTSLTAITRRQMLEHSKLKQLQIPFERLSDAPLSEVEVALCALGTTIKAAGSPNNFRKVDHDYILYFAQAAQRAGAKKFVLISALGADANSSVFYSRVKGETEHDLKALKFDSLIILQPSLLLGERAESRPMEHLAIKLEPFYKHLLVGSLKRYQPVSAEQVACVMVAKALDANAQSQTILNSEIINSSVS